MALHPTRKRPKANVPPIASSLARHVSTEHNAAHRCNTTRPDGAASPFSVRSGAHESSHNNKKLSSPPLAPTVTPLNRHLGHTARSTMGPHPSPESATKHDHRNPKVATGSVAKDVARAPVDTTPGASVSGVPSALVSSLSAGGKVGGTKPSPIITNPGTPERPKGPDTHVKSNELKVLTTHRGVTATSSVAHSPPDKCT